MTLEMKMDEMFDKGVEIGEQRGMERGLAQGEMRGIERGMAETEQKLVNNLMVNMNITKEEAKSDWVYLSKFFHFIQQICHFV